MGWKDVFAKGAGVAKAASAKAAPVMGKVVGGAGTAAGAAATGVKGALFGAGAALGSSAVGAVTDYGFFLFIAGMVTFVFNEYVRSPTLGLLVGTIFLFYSSILIFKGKGLIITSTFWLWYVVFGGVTDPLALKYVIGPLVLAGMAIHGLMNTITRRGSFWEGAQGEAVGIIPILIFWVDLGLVEWLVEEFGLSLLQDDLLTKLLIYMPYWGLLGLFTTTKENFFITASKVVAMVYIISVLTIGIAPEAYESYQSQAPGAAELLKAKQELREQFPRKENPFISQMACLGQGEFTDLEGCVRKRQEESKLKSKCELRQQQDPGLEMEECINEEREREKVVAQVGGIQDPTIKNPTTAEFIVSEYFPKSTYRRTDEAGSLSYPVEFKVQNLRTMVKEGPKEGPLVQPEPFEVEFSCSFIKDTATGIPGKILGQPVISFIEESRSITIVCSPEEGAGLDGNYKLVYNATLKNMVGISRLQRVFIGSKDLAWKEQWLPQIMQTYFSGNRHLSQSPADVAQLHFAFGNPLQNPIIEDAESVILSSTIENTGRGNMVRIQSYFLDLEAAGFTIKDSPPERNNCLEGEEPALPSTSGVTQVIYLPTCFLTVPASLRQPVEKYAYREFLAGLIYDYRISTEVPIEVKVITT